MANIRVRAGRFFAVCLAATTMILATAVSVVTVTAATAATVTPQVGQSSAFRVFGPSGMARGMGRDQSGNVSANGMVDSAQTPTGTEGPQVSGWGIEPTPAIPVPEGDLAADTCVSTTYCVAVGDSGGGVIGRPLAEVWNGSTWKVQPTPNPGGATTSFLDDVSCTSTTFCVAVGEYSDHASTTLVLTEIWNGTAWRIQSAPSPAGTQSVLEAVSCTSATFCIAAGSTTTAPATPTPGGALASLAEEWNGTSWSIQAVPLPGAGDEFNYLDSVSCTSTIFCIAVGTYYSTPFAEVWNGSNFSNQTIPNPSVLGYLSGVSCSSTMFCIAVGLSYSSNSNSAVSVNLAETWNGTSWSVQSTPNRDNNGNELLDITCLSSTDCMAAGDYYNAAGTDLTLAEVWNGTTWAIIVTPNPFDEPTTGFNDISCPTATSCIAVGDYNDSSGLYYVLSEIWNGTSWSIQTTAPLTTEGDSYLNGVSCTSTTFCTAVGLDDSNTTDVTLAEQWNGKVWSVESTPNVAGGSGDDLQSVSCISATACMAVGWSYQPDNSTLQSALAEQWNGSSWNILTTPDPSGASFTVLQSVSCTLATACTAVGFSEANANTYTTLAETWNGTTWSMATTPDPSGYATLQGVSCTASTTCTAVGSYDNSSQTPITLVETLSGTTWSVQTTPNPSGATASSLDGVSCVGAACTAVGDYINSTGAQSSLAETLSGTTWSVQTTPNPSGATSSSLDGVSCVGTACTAVGDYVNSSGAQVSLAEILSGTTWTVQTTPNPASGTGDFLYGLSCTSTTSCTAVGTYQDQTGTQDTLAEGYT